ncbi:hypothetical protein ABZ370_22355 [Streptomyces sp. NPDC005962]|uniref:hypothetical protein n=1 Tax=Streptomyces sp. NPDC005962 TaxID=3154466 RepID=UPI0033FD94D8
MSIRVCFIGDSFVQGIGHRVSALTDEMAAPCGERDGPVHRHHPRPLLEREVLSGDGAHPGSGGYRMLADIALAGPWHAWVNSGSAAR